MPGCGVAKEERLSCAATRVAGQSASRVDDVVAGAHSHDSRAILCEFKVTQPSRSRLAHVQAVVINSSL